MGTKCSILISDYYLFDILHHRWSRNNTDYYLSVVKIVGNPDRASDKQSLNTTICMSFSMYRYDLFTQDSQNKHLHFTPVTHYKYTAIWIS